MSRFYTSLIVMAISIYCVIAYPTSCKGYRFPIIPDSISDPDSRATYVVSHFWDNAETEAMTDAHVLETFFYALGKVPKNVRINAVNYLIDKCIGDTDRLSTVAWYIDFHLGSPESIYRDDTLYLQAQRHIVESPFPDEYKIAPRNRIELLSKNGKGEPAPDFTFTDGEGHQRNLSDIPMPCMLIFADSECGRCCQEQKRLRDELLELRNNGWNIITVYLDGIIPEYARDLPETESVPDTFGHILEDDLYVVRRLPSVYLIDRNKRILEKEINLNEISIHHILTNSN